MPTKLTGTHLVSGPVTFVRYVEHSPNLIVARRVVLGGDLRSRELTVGRWCYGDAEYVTKAGKVFVSDTMPRDRWRERVESIWSTLERL